MTTHYNIHITSTATDFKVTFRDGKFKKLEHLRGELDQVMLNSLGKIIPRNESDFEAFTKRFEGKVEYNQEQQKEKSLHVKFKDVWYSFYKKENRGRNPKFNASDGKALNDIIAYLIDESKGDENAALSVFNFILENWHHLPQFFKNNQDLKLINSKLNVIITALQNQHISNENTFYDAVESEAARSFQFGRNNK